MSSSPTQRSTYRHRRINVMLQESESEPVLPSPPPGKPPASRHSISAPASFIPSRTSRNAVIGIAIATAVLCAVGVFFLLFRTDSARAVQSIPSQPVRTAPAEAVAPKESASTSTALRETQPEAASKPTAPAPVQFKVRRGSRTQQAFGPLNLRVVTANPRRGTCSLAISSGKSRPVQRAIQLNRPIEVTTEDGATLSLKVTAVSRDLVAGIITTQ